MRQTGSGRGTRVERGRGRGARAAPRRRTGGRDRILAATRSLYLRHGEDHITMRRVAAEVGITATALYRHFESKEALIAEIVDDGFRVFKSYQDSALAGASPAERLRLGGAAYLRFALEQTEIYSTIFVRRPTLARRRPDARKAETFRFLVDRVEECLEAGILAPGDAEQIALTIWAHVHGLISLRIAGAIRDDEAAFRQTYDESISRLFRGLARRR